MVKKCVLFVVTVGQALFLDEDEVYEVNVASDRLRVITEVRISDVPDSRL